MSTLKTSQHNTHRFYVQFIFLAFMMAWLAGCPLQIRQQPVANSSSATSAGLTLAEIRPIAKEAYIYGYPMVDGYRVQYTYFVDRSHPNYKVPWNQLKKTRMAG